jgi:enoyl-CoA hydratase
MTDRAGLLLDRRESAGGHAFALVTVNRPKALNALNRALVEALAATFEELGADTDVDGIVLTGAGDRAFVAGADISELADLTPEAAFGFARRGQEVMRRIEGTPKPVIAAIGGYALGGGLELALACHLRVAAPQAKLGLPEVKLGVIPGYGGTQRLPRLVGRGRALRMILTGNPVGSDDALASGLVDAVHEDAVEGAAALLDQVLANGPLAVRNALLAVDAGFPGLEDGLLTEASLFSSLAGTDDMREGTGAFLEKRPARFRGA